MDILTLSQVLPLLIQFRFHGLLWHDLHTNDLNYLCTHLIGEL